MDTSFLSPFFLLLLGVFVLVHLYSYRVIREHSSVCVLKWPTTQHKSSMLHACMIGTQYARSLVIEEFGLVEDDDDDGGGGKGGEGGKKSSTAVCVHTRTRTHTHSETCKDRKSGKKRKK